MDERLEKESDFLSLMEMVANSFLYVNSKQLKEISLGSAKPEKDKCTLFSIINVFHIYYSLHCISISRFERATENRSTRR